MSSKGESARIIFSSDPRRFTAWKSNLWLRSITSATPAHRGATMHGSSHSGGWPSHASRPCASSCSLELVRDTRRPARWHLTSEKGVRHQRGPPSVISCRARAVADRSHRARRPKAAQAESGL